MQEDHGTAPAGPGLSSSGSSPSVSPPDGASIPSAEEVLGCLTWCHSQAEEIMAITAGCAMTHGDPGGGLEWANRIASDIAVNLEMVASGIAARSDETPQEVRPEGQEPGGEAETPKP